MVITFDLKVEGNTITGNANIRTSTERGGR